MEAKMKKLSDLLSKVSWLLTLPLTVFDKNVKHERKSLQKYVAAVCSPDMVTIVDGFNYYFCDLLQTIEQTKENVVKKLALTYEEMEQECKEIMDGFAEGKDLVVSVMSAMGEEQICALKDIDGTIKDFGSTKCGFDVLFWVWIEKREQQYN
ncbi:hypothetical protein ES288_D02G222900v1 [Gossypium darwinii]|nr:hypothetical protein ES288_D12G029800v1 [Gossypium darwinii]TYG61029.1 hypothetical protein ES288_D07G115400v1 [Gossypium darwinii]TYG80522.1 hypothetical protein ES288_D02G222900v1 [Gossypium darwinii]